MNRKNTYFSRLSDFLSCFHLCFCLFMQKRQDINCGMINQLLYGLKLCL